MEKYAIYTYTLKEKSRRNDGLFDEEMLKIASMPLEKRFELLFGNKRGAILQVQKFKTRGDAEPYPCCVLNHDEHVILLRLEKEKEVGLWEKQSTNDPVPNIDKTPRKSTPYSYIIIDNRPDIRQIAIQTNTEAWRNPNDVRDLLQESLNWRLDVDDYGLEVSIKSKMLPSKFWEYVDKRRKEDRVTIKSMTFSFTNHKRRPEIDISQALSSEWRHLESFMNWIDNLGGDKGEIKITPPHNNALLTSRKYADIKHMVEICMNSNYSLTVVFSDDITYKCNQDLRAEMPMRSEIIRREFEHGYKELFSPYQLIEWLDDAIYFAKSYQDVEDVKPKPGNKAKKQVS